MSLYEWIALLVFLIASYFALVKVIVGQFKNELSQKFESQDALRQVGQQEQASRLERFERQMVRFEEQMTGLQRELPVNYVRREDAIRENTIISAKLDAINNKIDKLAERRGLAREE